MCKQEAQQLIEQLANYQKKVTRNRKTALAALVRAGLVTENGQPTEFYGPNKKNLTKKKEST